MLKFKKLTFCLILILLLVNTSYGLDWIRLHEKASTLTLGEARGEVFKSPNSIDDIYVLGLVYLNLHKDKEAGNTFKRILSLNPKSIPAQWGVAEVLRRQHDLVNSRKMLEEIIKADPDFSPAYISIAYLEYLAMRFDKAILFGQAVLDQGSDNVDLNNFTRAYVVIAGSKGMIAHYGGPISKLINGTQVLPTLKKAEILQPDSPAVLFGIGAFYMLAPTLAGGNLDKSKEYLNKAIQVDPNFPDIYVRLAQVYKFKGDKEKYEYYLKKALELDPQNELALDIKGQICKFVCNR